MEIAMDHVVLSVVTTVGSAADARRLAREMLGQRLAACVQMDAGVSSSYWWKGAVCEDSEVRLTIKTSPECEAALQALFDAHHPYELPQFLATRMNASAGYAQWVREEASAARG